MTGPATRLTPRAMALVFLAFAFAYFFSALVRAVTATLAPVFADELGLKASHLGLLAGAYFFGFALMQLPLGQALDRHGPKRVLLLLLGLATLGCAAFALAQGLVPLIAARLLIGVGVSACLMAPLTAYRLYFPDSAQMRANSWMLMTGSLGMVASTLPVQWLLPLLGWRGLFWCVALCLVVCMLLIAQVAPADARATVAGERVSDGGYRAVWRHPMFVRMVPLGAVTYGGLVAMQALWIGPWLTQVGGHSAKQAAGGLLVVNLSMLLAFGGWGLAMPALLRRGWHAERLIALGWPLGVVLMAALVWLGPQAGALWWAAWCVCTSVVSLSQPAIGQAFAATSAGRALSAYNLVIFSGVFLIQWTIGVAIDMLQSRGWATLSAYQAAFGLFLLGQLGAGLWFQFKGRARGPAATAGQGR
ncbi:arabinose efflux permease family protein [Burkholderiales bacterium JOSHI_001]|nr:arabinose efflux permease family protein [Burkholderiales bacterium JOSHI_001]